MTDTLFLKQNITCEDPLEVGCSFTTRDVALFNNHSCDVAANGGHCEDYPCCSHEYGDCNGQKYGSDEAIKSYAMQHLGCDHEAGIYECYDDEEPDEPEDDDTYDEQPFAGSEY